MSDLEDIAFRLHCGVKALDAVHVCMTEGPTPADEYTDALYAMVLQLRAVSEELVALTQGKVAQ